jgi:TetR/AcrR family tetracycline transcriptional repressor
MFAWAAGAEKTRRAAAGRRQPLDLERIVRAALVLLDEAGLDGLSMRALAERLGVKAASLYWYVQNKDELLELLADAISAEVRPPEANLPWRGRMEALMAENRRVLLAHRDAARILTVTSPVGPNRLRLIELVFQALLAAGFGGTVVVRAGRLLNDYVTSFVLEEVNEAGMAAKVTKAMGDSADGTDGMATIEEVEETTRRAFAALPKDIYPAIAAVAAYIVDPDLDARFHYGLQVVLDGLEQQLSRTGTSVRAE